MKNFQPIIVSERLKLRAFTRDDDKALHEILKDEEVNTFLPWFPHETLEETQTFLQERFLKEGEIGYRYAICLRSTSQLIGYIQVDDGESHDLGYGLAKAYWHQGFASEACRLMIEQLKKDGFPYITATHDILNPYSGEVMKKIGMNYQYSYEECVEPKKQLVTFRLYQMNIAKQMPTYRAYWDAYPHHFVEEGL